MPEPSPAPDDHRRFPRDAFHSTHRAYGPTAIVTLPPAKSWQRPPARWAAGWRLRDPLPHAKARTSRTPPAAPRSRGLSSVPTLRRWAPPGPKIQTTAATTPGAPRPHAPTEESRIARPLRCENMQARSWSCRDRSRSPASFVHLCLIHLRIRSALFLSRLHRGADLNE